MRTSTSVASSLGSEMSLTIGWLGSWKISAFMFLSLCYALNAPGRRASNDRFQKRNILNKLVAGDRIGRLAFDGSRESLKIIKHWFGRADLFGRDPRVLDPFDDHPSLGRL